MNDSDSWSEQLSSEKAEGLQAAYRRFNGDPAYSRAVEWVEFFGNKRLKNRADQLFFQYRACVEHIIQWEMFP